MLPHHGHKALPAMLVRVEPCSVSMVHNSATVGVGGRQTHLSIELLVLPQQVHAEFSQAYEVLQLTGGWQHHLGHHVLLWVGQVRCNKLIKSKKLKLDLFKIF